MNIDHDPVAPDPRIAALIAEARHKPFAVGRHDCCTFAAQAVELATGGNPLEGLHWSSEREAARLVREAGGLKAMITQILGEPIEAGFARAGDVVLAIDPHDVHQRAMLTVCHGPVLLAPGSTGLAAMPLSAGLCAWRVVHD